ncbi:MAG: MBOAT family protein [Phycisphaerae bacterium]|nr:MBOAT family protein [Phycisphaerae bacterium]
MLFQTPEFLVVFLISVLGVAFLRRNTHQHFLMTILSYAFYAWFDVRFLILLLITSLVDYSAALGMDGVQLSWKKRWKLSGFVLGMSAVSLGLNWPLIQSHGEFSFAAFSIGEFVTPRWNGFLPSVAACIVFAAAWPFVYELLFRSYDGERRRKAFLVVSVICNLAVLGFFKYFNFFVDSLMLASSGLGLSLNRPHLDVLLPLGISFYTFVSMSYTIDAYRKELKAEQSFMRFSLFVCYYPHLVAGPIIRPDNFLPTLHEPWRFEPKRIISGFHLCLNGLFKKMLIADAVAPLADRIFTDPAGAGLPSLAIMLGAALFAVQIYCDFSGYSDIARGVSRMFGPELPINFDFPYFSTSIIDFWRTWHISLSTWLRDYLYIPLGGGRGSPPKVYFNLMTTMVLGGLWHGASANFVIWGFYQGLLLCVNRFIRWVCDQVPPLKRALESVPGTVFRWAVTMYFVLLGWLIFRVNNPKDPFDFSQLAYCIKKFIFFDGSLNIAAIGLGRGLPFVAALFAGLFCVLHTISRFSGGIHNRLDKAPAWILPFIYAGLAAAFYFFWPSSNAAFIYFQF